MITDHDDVSMASATFTSWCPYGCVVRTVDGREKPHVCVGYEVAAVLAPDVPFATVRRITEGLKPLLRERLEDAWQAGVDQVRSGGCCGGEQPPS